ncbi:MAG: hypothetical protein H0Z19_00975 [Archaeoglobus sp.]|uniref:hypothetical protein n=1 Tax=Archaeoglobus sp. TaxID=1872626 RepID=UPI001D40186D|nr:hypothetical protein [Archaeoglobus sp.]MBO8179047.1 hypothetical protein [Archaeoglobus sp.]
MGRAPLILLPVLLLFTTASAYDFDYSCSKTFDDYYFGGEYLYFTCTVTPDSSSDAKLADDQEYHVFTQLDSSALAVVVEYRDGKKVLYPSPQDEYSSDGGETELKIFVPESDDGVDEIALTVSGYVPVIDSRLENLTVLKVETEEEELIGLEITVVNKQKFYSDIRNFEDAECADEKKLKEAKLLYNDEKYRDAEELMEDIEDAVEECYVSSNMKSYQSKIDELKASLTEINKELILIQYRVENERDRIENYEEVKARYEELYSNIGSVDEAIDEVERLVNEGKFTTADTKINEIKDSLSSLKLEVEELKKSIREKSLIDADLTTVAVAGGGVALVAIAIAVIMNSRKKDKW